jgi:hypothetical protein
VDDYRFDPLWKSPDRYAVVFSGVPLVLSPDFSVYPEWPLAMQVWNVYRSRWLARKLAALAVVPVVPALTWGDRRSFPFSFAGIPTKTPVAVGTVGCSRAAVSFSDGYREMVARLAPSVVVVVGPPISPELERLVPVLVYPSESVLRARGNRGR